MEVIVMLEPIVCLLAAFVVSRWARRLRPR